MPAIGRATACGGRAGGRERGVGGAAAPVIEVDGWQHTPQRKRDADRTAYLEARGYRVISFWNNEVFENTEGGLKVIRAALRA